MLILLLIPRLDQPETKNSGVNPNSLEPKQTAQTKAAFPFTIAIVRTFGFAGEYLLPASLTPPSAPSCRSGCPLPSAPEPRAPGSSGTPRQRDATWPATLLCSSPQS